MARVAQKYKFAVIAVDAAVFTVQKGVLQVLLIKMKKHPFEKCWALPGGLVKPDESVDTAVARVLREKTAVKGIYLDQLRVFGEVNRDPFGRVVSVAYLALMPSAHVSLKTTKEYAEVAWFPVKEVPLLAYDHKAILQTALVQLKIKLQGSTIAYSLLPDEFTLSDLQRMYESILGRKLDKRNFRKKVLELGFLRALPKKRVGEANRPAKLYMFLKKGYQVADIL